MSTIRFSATLFRSDGVGVGILLVLPKDASAKLPSRGIAMVKGTINGVPFRAVLEPDGKESHWFKVDEAVLDAARAASGDTVAMEIEPTKEWLEPKIPANLKDALEADPKSYDKWTDITPAARWDWIRWIGSARQSETRQRRVESVCSRLRVGKRRPCCFDRNQCTLTET
jgi:hypothetical protein